jgi:hypothetical protein
MISEPLISRFQTYFNTFNNQPFVRGTFPIIYFGNEREYRNSPRKIITVGKNPSHIEFVAWEETFTRFPHWNQNTNNLISVLDSYFEIDPYTLWFDSMEPLLNGLEASFYPGNQFPNRVLHTDLCSPIATDPTWTKLNRNQRNDLMREGVRLWRDLVTELDPDLIIASISINYVNEHITPPQNILTRFQQRNQVYNVYLDDVPILGRSRYFLFGRAGITPFQLINNEQRNQAGQLARERIWPA